MFQVTSEGKPRATDVVTGLSDDMPTNKGLLRAKGILQAKFGGGSPSPSRTAQADLSADQDFTQLLTPEGSVITDLNTIWGLSFIIPTHDSEIDPENVIGLNQSLFGGVLAGATTWTVPDNIDQEKPISEDFWAPHIQFLDASNVVVNANADLNLRVAADLLVISADAGPFFLRKEGSIIRRLGAGALDLATSQVSQNISTPAGSLKPGDIVIPVVSMGWIAGTFASTVAKIRLIGGGIDSSLFMTWQILP